MTTQKYTTKSFKSVAIPFTIMVLIVSAFALLYAISFENNRFYHEQLTLAKSSVQGIEYNLNQFIKNKQNIVQSMIEHDRQFLLSLSTLTEDHDKLSYLDQQVKNRLKNAYSFSLTDKDGVPIINNSNSNIGQRCLSGLQFFARNPGRLNETFFIHGNSPDTYHIDVMGKIINKNEGPIFFVSFKIDSLVDLLKNSQAPGHKLFIVQTKHPENIEISDAGIKKQYLGQKQLSKTSLDSTMFQMPLKYMAWTILAIPEQDFFSNYELLLIKRAGIAFTCLLIIVFFFVWRLHYEEKSRSIAENNLNLSYKLLAAEVKMQTQELSDSKHYLESLFMSAPYGLIVSDETGTINSINTQAEKIFGYTQEELIGQTVDVLIPVHLRDKHSEYVIKFTQTFESKNLGIDRKLKGLTKNGHELPITVALNTINFNNKKMIIASINDVSELTSIQRQLTEEHERAVVTLSSIGDGVITTSIDGIIDSINSMAEKLTGWSSNKAIGEHISKVYCTINEDTREKNEDPVIQCLKNNQTSNQPNNNTVLIHKTGLDIPIEDNVSAIHNKEGHFIGIVLVFHDVSQSRQYAHEIEFQANHDALTGLLNRRKFDYYLTEALKNTREVKSHYVLLYMDLDRFKLVNDTAGHAAGDELLKQLTRTLSKTLRQRDIFSRLGGDEFGVLLDHCTSEDGLLIAKKLLESVDNFRFFWKEDVFSVGISIGLVAFSETEDSADKLLSEADAACYTAKENGRNRVQIYDEHAARKLNESHTINMLTYAFENNQMQLYQQKITSVGNSDENKEHYEILIRMLSNNNIIPPGMFLPAAERCGLAINIDRWVIRSVFKWLSKHQKIFSPLPIMAINLSGQSITDGLFSQFIEEQFSQFNIKPVNICFEITETAAMHNLDNAKEFIHKLKVMGCQFSLDDFGSGHASYAQLKHLPVDYLKIDGSLVKDILDDPIDFSIVKSINDVGHILGMKTIAEFVENTEIADKLSSINVDHLQGYGIAKPAPIDELITNHN